MATKRATRISSLFSLRSNSSEKSNDSFHSQPLPQSPPVTMESSSPMAPEPSPPIQPTEQNSISASSSQLPYPSVSLYTPPADQYDQAPGQPPLRDGSLSPPQMLSPVLEISGLPMAYRPRSHTESNFGSYDLIEGPSRPASQLDSRPGSRALSQAGSRSRGRPSSPTKLHRPPNASEPKLSRRRSWLPIKSKAGPEIEGDGLRTWFLHPETRVPYDATSLVRFQKVPELWQDNGDATIFLHAGTTRHGPSFKLDSAYFSSSRKLSSLVSSRSSNPREQSQSRNRDLPLEDQTQNLSLNLPPNSRTGSPQMGSSTTGSSQGYRTVSELFDEGVREVSVHVPLPLQGDLTNSEPTLTPDDFELLVAIRNVFAFLTGVPLVATSRHSTIFEVFLRIADVLQRYEFTNLDGSTFGEEPAGNFRRYMKDFKLADVRTSREKTIEAIVLGERMRCFELYNEGFVHGVGKYDDIIKLQSPKFHLISEITRQRLERATIDLSARLNTVRARLKDFEFPSLFSGIANSTNSTESKMVRFKEWRLAFLSMRRHVMSFYRHRYGAWPPSARSKKNSFEESGLNRILLLELYHDFSHLYDVLVSRSCLTTRTAEFPSEPTSSPMDSDDFAPALRRVMGEFDHSSPPVQPPIPFDTPLLPSLISTRRNFKSLDGKRQRKERMKPLQDDEINKALMQSYNRDSIKATQFLESFMFFERKQAHGKSIDEMMDLRIGQWMFLYAVLQSLPLVVIDAPNIKWTDGVEYFLCEVPKGTAPWYHDDYSRKMSWYGISGRSGFVNLPAELVEHGVDGIYHRSHCWKVAEKWIGVTAEDTEIQMSESPQTAGTPTLELPPTFDMPGSRSSSPGRLNQRNTIYIGLEALPLPAGVAPIGAKHTSHRDPQRSFDNILGKVNTHVDIKKK